MRQIGNTDHDVPAGFRNPHDLFQNGIVVFHVFKDLIADNKVKCPILVRNGIAFEIHQFGIEESAALVNIGPFKVQTVSMRRRNGEMFGYTKGS